MERVISGSAYPEKTKIEFAIKRKNKFIEEKVHSAFERKTLEIKNKRAK